jgi:hypothetical protein
MKRKKSLDRKSHGPYTWINIVIGKIRGTLVLIRLVSLERLQICDKVVRLV